MTRNDILKAVGSIGDEFILRCEENEPPKEGKRFIKWTASIAACLVFVLICTFLVRNDLNYYTARCGGSPGALVKDTYYYMDVHEGICSYSPSEGYKKLISELFRDIYMWDVNEYGIFYVTKGYEKLYVRPHESGEITKLFEVDKKNYMNIYISQFYDEKIVCRVKYPDESFGYIEIDCVTGATDGVNHEGERFKVGENIVLHKEYREKVPIGHEIYLNGELLFDKDDVYIPGSVYDDRSPYAGDNLILMTYNGGEDGKGYKYLVLRPSGETVYIKDFEILGGTDDYLFGFEGRAFDTLCKYELATGEVTVLIPNYKMQEIITDGVNLYTCAPWAHNFDHYIIQYADDGKIITAIKQN